MEHTLGNRVSLSLYLFLGLVLILLLLCLPALDDSFVSWIGVGWPLMDFSRLLLQSSGMLFYIFILALIALALDRTIGFGSWTFKEIRESWRLLPKVAKYFFELFGVFTLLLNAYRGIWFLLERVFQIEWKPSQGVLGQIHQGIGLLSVSSVTLAFAAVLIISVLLTYLRAPQWKRIRVPTNVIDKTMIFPTRLSERERKLMRRAEHQVEKGNLYKAAKAYEALGNEFCYRAGKLYIQEGYKEKALNAYGKAGDYYQSKNNFFRAGDAYFYGGFWIKAIGAYERFTPQIAFLNDKERAREWIVKWGESFRKLGRYKDAADLFMRYEFFREAGQAYEEGQFPTAAAQAYGKAGAYESSFKALSESGYRELAQLEKVKHLFQQGLFSEAGDELSRCGRLLEAAEAFMRAKQPAKAAACFSQAGDLEQAAETYLAAGEGEMALDCYQQMSEYKKAAQLAAHLGLQGQQAILYSKAKLWIPAARSYVLIDQIHEAVQCLKEVDIDRLEMGQESAQILDILCEQNRLKEALLCAHALMEGKKPRPVLAPLLYSLGKINEKLGKAEKAMQLFFQAAKLLPHQSEFVKKARAVAEQHGISFKTKSDSQPTSGSSDSLGPSTKSDTDHNTRPNVDQIAPSLEAIRAGAKRADTGDLEEHRQEAENMDNSMTLTLDDQSVFDLTRGGALERYHVISEMGKGGMGFVYKALDKKLKRTVALKMLHPEHNKDPRVLLFFKREAMAIASLNHPNLVHLYDTGMEKGCFYMIMEYVNGSTLERLAQKHPSFIRRNALAILFQACVGLKYAHDSGIIHRDLKPSNIMLNQDRRVKILDFGLAKEVSDISQTQQVWGTPAYMAPELFQGKRASFQTDIYGLGATFYKLVTLRDPFSGHGLATKFAGDGLPEPPHAVDPRIPTPLSKLIIRCLFAQSERRFKDMSEFLGQIKSIGKNRVS